MKIRPFLRGIFYLRNSKAIIYVVFMLFHSSLMAVTFEQETSGFSRSQTKDSRQLEEIDINGNIKKDWNYYGKEEVERFQIQQEYKVKSQDIFALREAKKAMINGDLELAVFFLSKINSKRSDLTLIKNRYLSMVRFIQGDYETSYQLISSNQYNILKFYKHICLLRVINLMAMDKMDLFNKEMAGCQNATIDHSTSNHFWLRQVSNIKDKNKELLQGNLISQLRQSINNNEFIKIWMKLALFINREDVIVAKLSGIPPSAYKDKEIRELIGFAYYRVGDIEKAQEFIEDIETPNADNIRGNINLAKNKLELAFGHFKLALQKKKNSKNALERGIPLAYLLGQWDEGLNMLQRTVDRNSDQDERKKLALKAVLNIRKGNISESRDLLNILEYKFNNQFPYELIMMDTFVSLKEGNQERLIHSSAEGCNKEEGLHCWLYMKILEWENIGKTLTRDEKTLSKPFNIENLKTKQEITPLQDSVMIDQKDIEELDGNDLNLTPLF